MSIDIQPGATYNNMPFVMHDSIFETGTVTFSSEDVDGFALNAVGDATNDFWTPTAVPSWIAVDYGVDVECDCAGVIAHTLGTTGATVAIQSSDDGISWVSRATITPTTDETIVTVFPLVLARYWRVYVTGFIASIGVIKLGKRVVFPSGVLSGHIGINHAQVVELLTNETMGGQFIGNRINRVGAAVSIDFGLIERDFVETDLAGFETHYNSGRTFLFASCPLEYPDDYGYCWRSGNDGELRPSYEEGGELMSFSMGVGVYVEQ